MISLSDLLEEISLRKADYFFTSSDGRELPCFIGFAEKLKAWKLRHIVSFPRSDDQALRKIQSRLNKIEFEEQLFKKNLETNIQPRVLDIAAGIALYTMLWAKKLCTEITAIDIHPWFEFEEAEFEDYYSTFKQYARLLGGVSVLEDSILEIYKKLGVNYVKMDAGNIDFPEQFDLVVTYNSLMEIKEVENVLRHINRVLKPGGVLCATWDNYYHLLGAHRKGAIDIPWGHALLSYEDYKKYADSHMPYKDAEIAKKYIFTLNHFTPCVWKELFEKYFSIFHWQLHYDPLVKDKIPLWLRDVIPSGGDEDNLAVEKISGVFIRK